MIQVQCEHCKKWFASGIQTDKNSFVNNKILGNQETCPLCKETTVSGHDNMRYFERD